MAWKLSNCSTTRRCPQKEGGTGPNRCTQVWFGGFALSVQGIKFLSWQLDARTLCQSSVIASLFCLLHTNQINKKLIEGSKSRMLDTTHQRSALSFCVSVLLRVGYSVFCIFGAAWGWRRCGWLQWPSSSIENVTLCMILFRCEPIVFVYAKSWE